MQGYFYRHLQTGETIGPCPLTEDGVKPLFKKSGRPALLALRILLRLLSSPERTLSSQDAKTTLGDSVYTAIKGRSSRGGAYAPKGGHDRGDKSLNDRLIDGHHTSFEVSAGNTWIARFTFDKKVISFELREYEVHEFDPSCWMVEYVLPSDSRQLIFLGFLVLFGRKIAGEVNARMQLRVQGVTAHLQAWDGIDRRLGLLRSNEFERVLLALYDIFSHVDIDVAALGEARPDAKSLADAWSDKSPMVKAIEKLSPPDRKVVFANLVRAAVTLRRLEFRMEEARLIESLYRSSRGLIAKNSRIAILCEFLYAIKLIPSKEQKEVEFRDLFHIITKTVDKSRAPGVCPSIEKLKLEGRLIEWNAYCKLGWKEESTELRAFVRDEPLGQTIAYAQRLEDLLDQGGWKQAERSSIWCFGMYALDAFRIDVQILAATAPSDSRLLYYRSFVTKAMEAQPPGHGAQTYFKAMLAAAELDESALESTPDHLPYNIELNRFNIAATILLRAIADKRPLSPYEIGSVRKATNLLGNFARSTKSRNHVAHQWQDMLMALRRMADIAVQGT